MSLLEQVMLQLQSDKKGNQGVAYALLNVLTVIMAPLSYLDGIVTLLQHPDTDVQRKVSVYLIKCWHSHTMRSLGQCSETGF